MLTFSKSEVTRFVHRNKSLRWGQAFHNHFSLEKIKGPDQVFCHKLYNASEETAKAMVASRIDHKQ